MQNEFNSSYTTWKKWGLFFEFDEDLARYFQGELLGIPLAGKRVFEIGFGAGAFLAWATKQGALVTGSELVPELVSIGLDRQFDARLGEAQTIIDPSEEPFDLIVAFDVLEHVPSDKLVPLLTFMGSILKADGAIVARFPNGQSPFGRAWQHGDITHVNTLSKGKFGQFAASSNLEIVRCNNAFRPVSPGFQGIKDRLQYWLRDCVQKFLCGIYALGDLPLDPNIVVVMRRQH